MTSPNTSDAAEAFDATTAAQFIHTIYSKQVQVARESKLVFADVVNRQYEEDASYGSSIKIHNISNLATVETKDSSLAHGSKVATKYVSVTDVDSTITIGTWQYSAIAVDTYAKKQADTDIYAKYAPKQGYDLGLAVDDVVAGLVDNITNTVGTLLSPLTYQDLLRADQYLNDADAPEDGRVIVVSPAERNNFLQLEEFINGDYSKLHEKASAAAKKANFGTWLGYGCYQSTNVEGSNAAGHDNVMMQMECLALVIQMKPTSHHQFDIDAMADKYVVEQIYGTAEMREDHGVWMQAA